MFIEAGYQFLEYLRSVKNVSQHTLRNYAVDLNVLKRFLEQELYAEAKVEDLPDRIHYNRSYKERVKLKDQLLSLDQIDKQLLRRFLADQYGRQSSPNTIVRRLSSLRTFFRYAKFEGLISTNPAEQLESPRVARRVPSLLSYEQVRMIFRQPDTNSFLGFRDRAILELFYSSGLRVSELVGLDRSDFDRPGLSIRVKGKGKQERVIPITHNASTWMQAYLDHPERHQEIDGHLSEQDPDAVFLNRLGSRLSARSVDRNFERYLKASGLGGRVTPHTIRHTIATHWLEDGMDLKTIKELLGHRSIAATTIYTKVSTKLKAEVHSSTHPRA